jgi:diguanylate cyclase (GGDEF)-like protein
MKILLVEDSATLRHAMSQYIIDAGHTPLIARSGEEALQLLEITPVDMIIMDVEMPGLNGFETTRLIREWLGGHWIPIVFVTGLNEDENYREGIEAGGDDYLIKPVSYMIIKAKIRAMERIAEMRDQLSQLNAELETLSQLDSLTHIYNRRTFNEMAHQQWLAAARQQLPIAALMIDVDHFKLYNDRYGHPAGDACLKRVTQAIKNCLHRPTDLLGRFGGEEFIVLLPETDINGTFKVAEAINKAISAESIRHETSPTDSMVTVSVGGACCTTTSGHSLEELVKTADRALYKAKRTGRNRALVDEVASHRTLLIIDPSQDTPQTISALLQSRCNILTTDCVTDAVDIAQDVRPDLIIIDADLADHNEGEVCKRLHSSGKTSGIPLLILSSTGCEERPDSDELFNVRACLAKPLDEQSLLKRVKELLHIQ